VKTAGTGHIYKRGSTYWIQFDVEGKRFFQTLGTKNIDDAKRKAEGILRPHRAGSEVDRLAAIVQKIKTSKEVADSGGAVATLLGAWSLFLALDKERRPCPSPSTLAQYEGHWNAFTKWMEKNAPTVKTMAQVKEDHATRFIRNLNAQGLSDGRVNKFKRFLKMFYRVMAQNGGGAENPFDAIKTARNVVQTAKQVFTAQELRDIVSTAKGEMQTLFLLGIGLGLRLGDCATLLWGEVDLDRRLVFRVPRKTSRNGETVKIGIPSELANHLSTLPRRRHYILPELAAEYEGGRAPSIARRIQAHLEACGVQTTKAGTGEGTNKRAVVLKGFHSFRHSYVSLNADAGTPQATMQKLVGHGSPAMTMHYLTPTDSMVLRAAESIPHLLTAEIVEPPREPLPKWAVDAVKNATNLEELRKFLLGD